jgi:hypothetical protein
MSDRAYVDRLNQSYFDGRLSAAVVEHLSALPVARADVRAFVERMFRTMTESGFGATDVSVLQGLVLGSLLARLLPETWAGHVPPVTVAGRHSKIDELVRRVFAHEGDPRGTGGRLFVDVACGFPPLTSIDTANALRGWEILGIDLALPAFLVHDERKNYATLDETGRAMYFQPGSGAADDWMTLMQDWAGTRRRFESLLQTLLAERAQQGSTAETFEHNGAKLETNPPHAYERPNVHFVRSTLEAADVQGADVVRCFNMLYYFDDAFRRSALQSFERMLGDDGLLVYGGNWVYSTECRYFTYRKRQGRLQPSEFGFSLDNVNPLGIISWYTLHDDCREVHLLAELVRTLRSDDGFRSTLLAVTDAMRMELGLCPRGEDGYYGGIASTVPPTEIWPRAGQIGDRLCAHELGSMAVDVLARHGWRARVNEVGHVAVAIDE